MQTASKLDKLESTQSLVQRSLEMGKKYCLGQPAKPQGPQTKRKKDSLN
jgi:hypothetical protein